MKHSSVSILAVGAVVLLAAAGCGSGKKGASGSTAASTQGVAAARKTVVAKGVPARLLKPLPPKLRAFFAGTPDPVGPSRYGNFAPVKKPWKICFADSYEGNSWRLDVRKNLEVLNRQFAAAGLTTPSLTVTNSNGDVALANSQLRQLIDQHCKAILMIPGSATGTNAAIAAAYKKGIPVVSLDGAVTSPYAINVNSNYYLWGRQMAQEIVRRLHGHGNVIMVEGIAGQPLTTVEDAGAKSVFDKAAGVKVVAEVNGNWTASVTKTALIQALASHPEKIDAVWTTGGQLNVVDETFQQQGRPLPLVTGSPAADSLAYMHSHKGVHFFGGDLAPTWTAQTGFRVAVRLLEGQHPKLNTIYVPIPSQMEAALKRLYRPCMTESAETPWPVENKDPMPESLLNGYFRNGKATPPYSYKKTPQPCG